VHVKEAVRIPERDLPLTLPETDNFKPSGKAESPLANIDDWMNYTDPTTGTLLLHPFMPGDFTVSSPSTADLSACNLQRQIDI